MTTPGKHGRLLRSLRPLLGFAYALLRPLFYVLSLLVPRDPERWAFTAGPDGRFTDNAKYAFLYCEHQDDVRNVWITSDAETRDELVEHGYEAYAVWSLAGAYHYLRSGVIFRTHEPVAPELTGRAPFVQLSHGNYMKLMGRDNDDARYGSVVEAFAGEYLVNNRTVYTVSSLGPPADVMSSAFDVPEERLVSTGFPRNDVFFRDVPDAALGTNDAELVAIADRGPDRPTVLYAPTWREAFGQSDGVPLRRLDLGLEALDDLLADYDATLLVTTHPASTYEPTFDDADHVRVLDTGGDITPFLKHVDVLVTDYSGVFYDFSLLDRPIAFYAPDLEEYTASRGFYVDYEEHVPGPVVRTPSELERTLRSFLEGDDEHAEQRAAIRDGYYEHQDGDAARRVYESVRDRFCS